MGGIGRFFAIVVAVCFAVALAGCSASSSSGAQSAQSSQASSESVQSAEASGSATADTQAASSAEASSGESATSSALAPGEYIVDVSTDSNMFHINEADENTGKLTVSDDGTMIVHIRLPSKNIVNLYSGTADEAKEDPDGVINPTTDTVTYSDGYKKEVYGFDVPVPALDEEFDVAILGTKGKWYDHKVIVSNPKAE